jgi:hypothetical protein
VSVSGHQFSERAWRLIACLVLSSPSQYTVAEDTLGRCKHYHFKKAIYICTADSDDLIFPRAATRVGPKYQAVIPPAADTVSSAKDAGNSPQPQTLSEGEERGGSHTIEVLSIVNSLTDEEGVP